MRTPMRTTDGRIVATVIDDLLHKRVESKHMLLKPLGWAFDVTLIEDAVKAGASRIEVVVSDTGITYSVSVSLFLSEAFSFDRHFNPQLGLRLEHWTVTGDERLQVGQTDAVQLGLPL